MEDSLDDPPYQRGVCGPCDGKEQEFEKSPSGLAGSTTVYPRKKDHTRGRPKEGLRDGSEGNGKKKGASRSAERNGQGRKGKRGLTARRPPPKEKSITLGSS